MSAISSPRGLLQLLEGGRLSNRLIATRSTALVRNAAARCADTLCSAIASALAAFTPQECARYRRHAGYASTRSGNTLISHRRATGGQSNGYACCRISRLLPLCTDDLDRDQHVVASQHPFHDMEVLSRMLWKFPGGALRACEGSFFQAARSRGSGLRG